MKYNFDEHIDRKNTNSLKYDFAVERNRPSDILPLWVADMDFRLPNEVLEEMKKSVEHGIFGYSDTKDDYTDVLIDWFKTRFDFDIKKEWLVKTPGIVYAICMAIQAFTKEGDAVLIQKPVYYPFSLSIIDNNRKLVNNPLVYKDGKYSIDFEDFENKIVENDVKMFILCSPHNPVGRVWTKEELIKLGNICLKHNVIVVSDEIHMDFTRNGIKHSIFLSLDNKFMENTVLLTAPSKTFNIAGLQVSNVFIPNENLKNKFIKAIDKSGYSQLNTLGLVATKACYQYGKEWLSELKIYLESNLVFIDNFLKENLPKIKLVQPQGTYLAWVDFSELNLSDNEINDIITNKCKLWLDDGAMFGIEEGKGFQRINYACQKSTLEKALNQLKNEFEKF